MIRWSVLAVAFVLAASSARADCVAFVGGRIVLPGRTPSPGTVVIRDRRIVDAGASVAVPDGCRRIATEGKVVTAGFIDPSTTLGVDEIDLESSTQDDDAGGNDPVRAAFRVADGYNARSVLIPVARLGGVTSCVVSPEGGTVSGQAAWVDLVSSTQDDAVAKAPIARSR